MSSGTVFAISSTAPEEAAPPVVGSSSLPPELSVPAAQPDSAMTPDTANIAVAYHQRGRPERLWFPDSTFPLLVVRAVLRRSRTADDLNHRRPRVQSR
ncbi:hypothetical protein MMUR_32780 [Mycolicibacterium murale]|uniref:Uncharacterized protein n=1 Tax=Mycolicibacterium murale TaxID=182220 RepID=A0A7I9WN12_9MYCO|nr:hypothetical protein MTOK_52830 [Mycolicibacterium tokaiense]GFG59142.1 hypothetical protein MMUR_32780 [Mycolicibacterium murale]